MGVLEPDGTESSCSKCLLYRWGNEGKATVQGHTGGEYFTRALELEAGTPESLIL